MKPPAFQFYARDWLSSTLGMPWDVAGLYIHLLAWSWDNGPLPEDPRWRKRIVGDAKEAARLWSQLERRWQKTADGWINLRLEKQRDVQADFRARAKKMAAARWQPDAAKHGSSICLSDALQSASASADLDQDQPAAPAFSLPPFKVYAAIAREAVKETTTNDLGDVAETFKKKCAQQGLPYDANVTTKALKTATRKRA